MAVQTRVGAVPLNTQTRLHVPQRYIPIVFVPDILGTRLMDGSPDNMVWSPFGSILGDDPGMPKADLDRLAETTSPLDPCDQDDLGDESRNNLAKRVRHLSQMVLSVYLDLLRSLADVPSTGRAAYEQRNLAVRVYCCGYDWRLDQATSAMHLATVVDEALAETRASQVVIVAHGAGGNIARYYSRILGGESRIQKMILLGVPLLGTPEAYRQLKHGMNSAVFTAMQAYQHATQGNVAGLFSDAMETVGTLATAVASPDVLSAGESFLGGIYPLLIVGGRTLPSREDTRDLLRRMPSLYQLMPNSIYCDKHRFWLTFNMLGTGYTPTGRMLVPGFSAQSPGEMPAGFFDDLLNGAVQSAAGPSEYVSSGQAEANMVTVVQLWQEFEANLARLVSAPVMGMVAPAKAIVADLTLLASRFTDMFMDARDARSLYADLFTGLTDVLSLRPISAANLELAARFDEALTVKYRRIPKESPADLLQQATSALGTLIARSGAAVAVEAAVSAWGRAWLSRWTSHPETEAQQSADEAHERSAHEQSIASDRQAEQRRREEQERNHPRAYVHPRTFVVYGTGLSIDAGVVLEINRLITTGDTNAVDWRMLPGLPIRASGGGPPTESGDGIMSEFTTHPPDELLLHPFIATYGADSQTHNGMLQDEPVIKTIEDWLSRPDELDPFTRA